jgi:hypothetical protein
MSRMKAVIFASFLCQLLFTLSVSAAEVKMGQASGQIVCPPEQACSGIAVLWPADEERIPDPRKYTVIPASVSPLKEDGRFDLAAPVGDYFVGAILRNTPGPLMGPPRPGDQVFMTPDLAGTAVRVSLTAEQTSEVGVHAEGWVFQGLNEQISMGVRGQLLGLDGQPVPGLLVFAFADQEMSRVPLAVSARSDAGGRFVLPLAKPGKVYLRVRKTYRGGRPEPGDHVGVFGGNLGAPLLIEEGRVIEGLKIQVRKIPDIMQMRNAPASARPRIDEP